MHFVSFALCLCWSQVSYRKGKEELHHYNTVADRPDIVNATNAAKLASDVSLFVCEHVPTLISMTTVPFTSCSLSGTAD